MFGQSIFSNIFYIFAVGFVHHFINDLLFVIATLLRENQKERGYDLTWLSVCTNPLESRMILKVPFYKNTIREIFKDVLFIPSLFLLTLELLNDLLVLTNE